MPAKKSVENFLPDEVITEKIYLIRGEKVMLDIEEIKKKLTNQDKNIELVFSYLDELMEKQNDPEPRLQIGYKRDNRN